MEGFSVDQVQEGAVVIASDPVKIGELVAKKLALWHTPTFRPIMTHDELEPLMAVAGFVPLPLPLPSPEGKEQPAGLVWREYASPLVAPAAAGARKGKDRKRDASVIAPCPRLPYPRIDGLHLETYKAFLLALEFYLCPTSVPNLFHIRSMPLSTEQDREFEKVYRTMKDCEMTVDVGSILVYRDGFLDHITRITCSQFGDDDEIHDDSSSNAARVISGGAGYSMNKTERNDGIDDDAAKLSRFVRLEDLLPDAGSSSRS